MMTVLSLWLPILIAAVLVFLASSVIHMVLGFHNKDVGAIPDERKVADALRPFAIPPGDYAMPHGADAKEMATPEFIQKTKEGPVAFLTVLPNEPMNMGKSLGMWFSYSLVVGGFAAYVAGMTLGIGAEYGEVFRVVAAVSFAGYSLAVLQASIWWGRSWGYTVRTMVDGVVYGLLTGGVFGWLWP